MRVSFAPHKIPSRLENKGADVGDAEAIKIARALEKNTSLKGL